MTPHAILTIYALLTTSKFDTHPLFYLTSSITMRVFLALLSLAATAFAYQVTSPNSQESWYSHGTVTVSWQRVDTDAEYFTMVLYNDVNTSAHRFQTPL